MEILLAIGSFCFAAVSMLFLGKAIFVSGSRKESIKAWLFSSLTSFVLLVMLSANTDDQAVAQDSECSNRLSACLTEDQFKSESPVFQAAVEACQEKTIERSARQAEQKYNNTTGDVRFGKDAIHQLVMFSESGGVRANILTLKDEDLLLKDVSGRWLESRSVCGFNLKTMEAE